MLLSLSGDIDGIYCGRIGKIFSDGKIGIDLRIDKQKIYRYNDSKINQFFCRNKVSAYKSAGNLFSCWEFEGKTFKKNSY